MNTIDDGPPAANPASILAHVLADVPQRIVACSGGVDSLLLADLAHSQASGSTIVAHSVTPAVPEAATERVRRIADDLGWRLEIITSAEFEDERYLANPVNRCYFCKTNLYDEIDRISRHLAGATLGPDRWIVLSGANLDDLGEYRPGLTAAGEHGVRHPYVEAGLDKAAIRSLARGRDRAWHDLPAAPCLASRLYTGTPVTPSLVRAVDRGEVLLRERLGLEVLRCRIDGDEVRIEVADPDHPGLDAAVIDEVLIVMQEVAPTLTAIAVDAEPYRSGRSFVHVATPTLRTV